MIVVVRERNVFTEIVVIGGASCNYCVSGGSVANCTYYDSDDRGAYCSYSESGDRGSLL